MAGDAVLTRDGPVTAPLDYVVPSSGELVPRSIRATIDGTGAAVTFYAALQVLAPSGRVMFSAISTSIAAGASADVSWFPGVIGGGGGVLTVTGNMMARVNSAPGSTQSIPNLGEQAVIWGEAPIDTGNPTPFWNAADPTKLSAPTHGYYLILPTLSWNTGGGFVRGCYMFINAVPVPPPLSYNYEADDAPPAGGNYFQQAHHMQVWELQAGDYVQIYAYHDAGGPLNLQDLRPAENHYSSCSLIQIAAIA